MKDKGQLTLSFPITVPPIPITSSIPTTPSTPKRKRLIDEEDEAIITSSKKGHRTGVGDMIREASIRPNIDLEMTPGQEVFELETHPNEKISEERNEEKEDE